MHRACSVTLAVVASLSGCCCGDGDATGAASSASITFSDGAPEGEGAVDCDALGGVGVIFDDGSSVDVELGGAAEGARLVVPDDAGAGVRRGGVSWSNVRGDVTVDKVENALDLRLHITVSLIADEGNVGGSIQCNETAGATSDDAACAAASGGGDGGGDDFDD